MPRGRPKKVDVIAKQEALSNRRWIWIAPEFRDENYKGMIMESKAQLEEAEKQKKLIAKEIKKWLKDKE